MRWSRPSRRSSCSRGESDLRFNWAVVRLAEIDEAEMQDLVVDAWAIVVPKSVAAAYAADDPSLNVDPGPARSSS